MSFAILNMIRKFVLIIVVLLSDAVSILLNFKNWPANELGRIYQHKNQIVEQPNQHYKSSLVLLANAKGVAGLGKAGGDGTAGTDKAGQQVPPEVYNALTYAGTAFLFTLSVPLILYGLNKLFNKIEDCFGCGPSSKKKKAALKQAASRQTTNQDLDKSKPQQISPQLHQPQRSTTNHLPQQQYTNLLNNNNNNDNNCNQAQASQHQSQTTSPPDSTAITLPVDFEMNYKTPSAQSNFQQPYIISSPHL